MNTDSILKQLKRTPELKLEFITSMIFDNEK